VLQEMWHATPLPQHMCRGGGVQQVCTGKKTKGDDNIDLEEGRVKGSTSDWKSNFSRLVGC